jgi:hypothetical protein
MSRVVIMGNSNTPLDLMSIGLPSYVKVLSSLNRRRDFSIELPRESNVL